MRGHDRREAAMTRAMPAASVRKPASRGLDVVHHCLEFVRLEVASLTASLRGSLRCSNRTSRSAQDGLSFRQALERKLSVSSV